MNQKSRLAIPSLALALAVGGIALGCASASLLPTNSAPGNRNADGARAAKGSRTERETQLSRAGLERANAPHMSDRRELNASGVDYDEATVQGSLARLGSIREEARGMVIVLPGSILFAPDVADLVPDGRTRLDDVVTVLLATREHNLTIEGHTNAGGMDANSIDLSRRRVKVVRDYIVERNYQPTLVQTSGATDGHPAAARANSEGRTNDHRIEIIVSHDARQDNRH